MDGLKDKENTVEFLTEEVAFSTSLRDGLKAIQVTRDRLRDVEKLATERKIHEALITLEGMIVAPPTWNIATPHSSNSNSTHNSRCS